MRTHDFSPLLRATVGFDRMMNMLDQAGRLDEESGGYPPYNIEKTGDDQYRITMAVAGFAEDDLKIEVVEDSLMIEGRKLKEENGTQKFLHRGIATRAFRRSFQLADHIKVVGAQLENGLLHVALEREVPEEKKPRQINIRSINGDSKVIENAAS